MALTITHTTPADGTFSATGAAAWDATHTFSVTGTSGQVQYNNAGDLTGAAGITTDGTTLTVSGSSAGDMVRITQTGAGNALLVEDSANPDATPFVIDASGTVVVGRTSPVFITGVIPAIQSLGTGNTASTLTARYSDDTEPPRNWLFKSRSTTAGGHVIVNNGDDLAQYRALGSDGTNYINSGQIAFQVDGAPGTNDMPGRITFSTTADGAASTTERMRIDSAGNVGIGTSAPAVRLDVAGESTITSGIKTASAPALDISQTWNNGAVNFTTMRVNSTNTASGSVPYVADFQIGGTSQFGVSKFYSRLSTKLYIANNTGVIEFGISSDVIIGRKAAASFRFGNPDAAAPVAQTVGVQSVVAGTTNTAGVNLTIAGSQGTGTGAGGSIVFQVAAAGSTGTAQNALASAMVIDSARTVRVGTGYTVATLPAAGVAGRRTYVTDATAPTFLGALVGGGSTVCPVFDNGTSWVSA